jgi:cellobiose phosphorylase
MRVDLSNTGSDPINFVPTAAIPIYGRSADNLRDHRHVTSLLQRTFCHPFGVYVKHSMAFDERGHTINQTTYAVLGVDSEGDPPRGFFPLVEEFIGEGGDLAAPQAVLEDDVPLQVAGSVFEGFESLGGLRFPALTLPPGQSVSYIIILGILGADQTLQHLLDSYGSVEKFEFHLAATKTFWQTRLSALRFDLQDARFDGWLQWVTLQPTLRRVMGNSFLPYHDYGRGGRGWRDLWQDLLALMLTENRSIRSMLIDNFAGVRLDGSNATILGSRPGEFIADRNSIPRVWMDHGAWPLLTIKRYLDLTADLDLLLAEQTYFKDHLTHRCQEVDKDWRPSDGTSLKGASGELWQATLLEHLLVQHLTAFLTLASTIFFALKAAIGMMVLIWLPPVVKVWLSQPCTLVTCIPWGSYASGFLNRAKKMSPLPQSY